MKDHEIMAEWLEAQWRIRQQSRNEAGRAALSGEWMLLRSQSVPEIAAQVEAFCTSLNQEWGRK